MRGSVLGRFILTGFLLLSLSSLSFAQAEQSILGILPNWLLILAGAFAIGFGLAAIAYMASTAFRLPELSVWAKSEVGEMLGTAFLIAIILVAVVAADGVYKSATGQTPMEQSLSFTTELSSKQLEIYLDSLELSKTMGLIGGIPPQYSMGGAGSMSAADRKQAWEELKKSGASKGGLAIYFFIFSVSNIDVNYQKFSGLSAFQSYFGLVQSSVMGAAGIAIILQMLASFISDIALPVMMPLGVFLSCFSLTRKMGRTFIAFGIGMYFFFPASIMLSKAMYDSAYKPGLSVPLINKPSTYFVGNVFQGMQQIKMYTGILSLLPENIGPLPFALPCLLLIFPPAVVVCWNFMWNVFWPNYAKIALHYIHPIATAVGDMVAMAQGGAPGELIAMSQVPGLGAYAGFKAQFYIEKKAAEQVSDIVLNYTPYMMQYSVPVMLMPVIIILMLIAAVRAISPSIGGEVQIIGVSELI
jgi:hypothetical protein